MSAPRADVPEPPIKLRARELSAWRGNQRALTRVDLDIPAGQITAVVGPSRCGKSTLLRCFNRLHELRPKTRLSGERWLDGVPLEEIPGSLLRCRVGTLFRRPVAFPGMSIRDNVLAGVRLTGRRPPDGGALLVEQLLQRVGLWSALKDRLNRSPAGLSRGQLQRLCLARALAVGPEVLLLDEPCWGLDPIETAEVEDAIQGLGSELTVVLATHSVQRAAHVSHSTAILLAGRLVEVGPTERILTAPADPRTEDYVTQRFEL